MESILDYLKRRLNEAGASRWELIAVEAGVARSLPRKIVWDKTRDNPGVQTIQPLLDFFAAVDRGERALPNIGMSAAEPTSAEIIERLGGPSRVAELCECTPQAVSQWFGVDPETGQERSIPKPRILFLRAVRPDAFASVQEGA